MDKKLNINQEVIEGKENNGFNDTLDLYKDIASVHTNNLNSLASKDFIYSFLSENQDKEYVIEMVFNAFMSQKIYTDLLRNTYKYYIPHGLKDKKGEDIEGTIYWKDFEEDIKRIKDLRQDVSDMYLNKINTLMLLNRNKKGNALIEYLTQNVNAMNEQEDQTMQEKLKEKLTRRDDK